MASRATRYLTPIFRSSLRSSQTAFRASGKRGMSTTGTSPPTQSSDMPWIIGSGLIFVPTVAWILSSGKGEKHAHPSHAEVTEPVKESPKERSAEPITAEPTPEPVPEEKLAEAASESNESESVISDDEGVMISKEELEESISKAVDADVPKEAKAVETTEVTSHELAPTQSESEPMKDDETTEPNPPPVSKDTSTKKKETKGH